MTFNFSFAFPAEYYRILPYLVILCKNISNQTVTKALIWIILEQNKAAADGLSTAFEWQGQKDSNPRHAVLETAALPTELYPYTLFNFV